LAEALHHEGRERGIENGAEQDLEEGEADERKHRHPAKTPHFAEERELAPPFQTFVAFGFILFFGHKQKPLFFRSVLLFIISD